MELLARGRKKENLGRFDLASLIQRVVVEEDERLIGFFRALAAHVPQIANDLIHDENFSQPETRKQLAGNIRLWFKRNGDVLSAIRNLDLSQSHLKVLPKEIGYFKELRVLTLSRNALTSLPREIGDLKHLQMLILFRIQ